MPPTTEQDSKVMGMVLKALNDLKSDMGTVKKILNISDGTKTVDAVYPRQKTGYRVNEKREKTKSRFAGAIAKGPKVPKKYASSVPQPLTSRVVTFEQSDSDSEQSAQFAGIQQQYKHVVPDYHILTADHNETVLGGKCLLSFTKSPQNASAGTRPKIRDSIPGVSKGQCGLRIPVDHRLPMIPCQMALASGSIILYQCPKLGDRMKW